MSGKDLTASLCRERFGQMVSSSLLAFLVVALLQACAPVRASRPLPPAPSASSPSPPQVSSLARTPDTKPTVEQDKIKEENLKEKRPAPQARTKDRPGRPAPAKGASPSLPD